MWINRIASTFIAGVMRLIGVDLDDLHADLAEIDENLIRCNLTSARKATAVTRRKAIYLELDPETAAGAAGGHAKHGAASDNLSFAESTANATAKDRRTIERAAARGEALGDDLNDIAGTSLDKGVELDALSKTGQSTPICRSPHAKFNENYGRGSCRNQNQSL